jgi:hypothetical protein
LHLHPNIACVTSMDADHLDIYGTSEEIVASFVEFANKVEDKSQLFITNELPIEGVTCAVNEEAVYKAFNVRVGNGSYVFDVQTPTETIKDMFNGNRAQKQTAKMLITSLSSHSGSRVEGILKNSILKNYNNIIKFIFEHYERKESDYTVDPYTMNFSPSPKVLLKEIIDRLFEEQDFSRISIETRDLIREWYTDNLYENISI